MPRAGRKHANQHNSRHENGVVPPGKRVVKQKSNGQLNGSADPRGQGTSSAREKSGPSAPPPLPPSPAEQPSSVGPRVNGTTVRRTSSQASKSEPRASPANTTPSDAEWSESCNMAGKASEHRRRINVDTSAACANHTGKASSPLPSSTAAEMNPLHLTLTVLRACPLQDTLAILIFLLSLPPTMMSIINGVFLALTFVWPAGSFTSLPTLTDIVSAPGTGAPSFIVVVLLDAVTCFLHSLFAPSIQTLFLDYAQAMIATTLGGRTGSQRAGSATDLTMPCVLGVTILHVLRHQELIARLLDRTWLWRWLPETQNFDYFSFQPIYPTARWDGMLDTLNRIVAIHIVCQGFTRWFRNLIYTSQLSSQSARSSADPEAVVGTHVGTESQDSAHGPPNTPNTLRSIASLQNLREGKEKLSSGKRRKRQSNFVRSTQPLWAAFAATKQAIMREYDQALAQTEARGANATDGHHLGNAQFFSQESRVWITEILPLNFFFETGHIPRPGHGKRQRKGSEADDVVERSSPLCVRISGAAWASVKIKEFPDSEDEKGRPRWTGEVYGFSPSNTYHVTFNVGEDGAPALYKQAIATPSLPVADQAQSPATPAPRLQLPAPTSPISTLRASILAVENSINEVAANQRRVKKDSRAASNSLRKEIDQLKDKLNRHATTDKSLQSRQTQHAQQIRQADDAVAAIIDELDTLGSSPHGDVHGNTKNYDRRRVSWERGRKEQVRARDELQSVRDANQQKLAAAQHELVLAKQKRDHTQQRIAKLAAKHARLAANPSSSSTPEQSKASAAGQAAQRALDRQRAEAQLEERKVQLERRIADLGQYYDMAIAQIDQLESAAILAQQQQQAQHANLMSQPPSSRLQYESSRPMTPEGDLPGTNLLATIHQHQPLASHHHQQPSFASPGQSTGFRRQAAYDSQSYSLPFGPIGTPVPATTPSTGSSSGGRGLGPPDAAPHDSGVALLPIGNKRKMDRARAGSGNGNTAASRTGADGVTLGEADDVSGLG